MAGFTKGPWRLTTWGDGIIYDADGAAIAKPSMDRDGVLSIDWLSDDDAAVATAAP